MATRGLVVSWVALSVTNGPSFWKMVLALFDLQDVEFTIETLGIGRVKARITSVSRRKDGIWGIKGELCQTDHWGLSNNPHSFKGSYDPGTRKGPFSAKAIVIDGAEFPTNSLLLLRNDRSPGGDRFRHQLGEMLRIPIKAGVRDTSNVPGFLEE